MRIASLSPVITEILFAFDMQDQIVCTDKFSDYPEEAQSIAHVKDHTAVDPRELYDHEVELVLTLSVAQEKVAEQLRARDFSVSHHDPRTIHDIYEMIHNLGMILQVEDKAKGLVLQMQQGFKDVKRKSGLLPRRLRVYIEGCSDSWVTEVAHIAGVELTLDKTSADFSVAAGGRIIDKAILQRPGPRLVDGARYLYGWAFENLH
jgi:ABC-type hemin transport system substrate-binding protein